MGIVIGHVRTDPVREDLCEKIEQKMLDLLNDNELNGREVIYILGQMLVDLGGSIEGVTSKVDYNGLRRRYAVNPTLGNALMAQGTDMLDEWIDIKEDSSD